jgi:sugar transferase (PEP-CTERM/EpsH1 system associated)
MRPHIIHTRNWGAIEGAIAARLCRVPVVIHGEHGRDLAEGAKLPRRRHLVRRMLFPFLDQIVVVSQDLQRWVIDELHVQPRKVTWIPNGVDTERFQPRADRERLRHDRGYAPTQMLIGAVGRLHPVKNYPILIEAFDRLLHRHPSARLVIIGDGPTREALGTEIRRRNLQHAVQLTGHRDDVPEWLAAMDLFVQASLMEGTSNALLEAMAVGLPVIATAVGGNPEVVVDGVTGRLLSVHDAPALTAAMEFYCLDEEARRQHGGAGRDRTARCYSMQDMIARYVGIYHDTLARRSRG